MRCLILDDRLRITIDVLAGRVLDPYRSGDYARYCSLVAAWARLLEASIDIVEGTLFVMARSIGSRRRWDAAHIRTLVGELCRDADSAKIFAVLEGTRHDR